MPGRDAPRRGVHHLYRKLHPPRPWTSGAGSAPGWHPERSRPGPDRQKVGVGMRAQTRKARGKRGVGHSFLLILCLSCGSHAETASPLYARGYTVVPVPQRAKLEPGDFVFGSNWQIKSGPGVPAGDIAVESLKNELQARDQIGAHWEPDYRLLTLR